MKPIGIDLKLTLNYSRYLIYPDQSPKPGVTPYPPFANIILSPLLAVNEASAYRIITMASFILYLVIIYLLPYLISCTKRVSGLLTLVLISGLFSYGFQFELERGQLNIIVFAFCFVAIWIYHNHPKFRLIAYVFFTIAVQIKVYPFIFIVMFVQDWRDWKNNLLRFAGLISVNIALLFALGPKPFVDFWRPLSQAGLKPYVWIGNHSIRAFSKLGSSYATEHGWGWISNYSGIFQGIMLITIAACIIIILIQGYRNKHRGIDPYLLLGCTIAALLIPSTSHDYKLAILGGPIALLFVELSTISKNHLQRRSNLWFHLTALIMSISYFSTLYSYTNKPQFLKNNFPALFILLLTTTLLYLMQKPALTDEVSKEKQPEAADSLKGEA